MSRKVPVGQVRLTNIAIVKYKAKGLRFEIACFPNKVLDYRKKVEKDIKNVIQSPNVFSNVSKGSFARRDDLMEAFGTIDQLTILNIILEKGELQVTERERQSEIANKTKEIINYIAGMCVNSETKQPVSARVIEEGFKNAAFQINLTQTVKQQAMKVFHVLSQTLPIERAKMKIIVASPAQYAKSIKNLLAIAETTRGIKITNIVQTVHSTEFTIIIDPGLLREITDDVTERTNGQGDISVADLQVDTEDLLAAQSLNLDDHMGDYDNSDGNNDDSDNDMAGNHFDNFGSAIDIDNIASAFGKIISPTTTPTYTQNDSDDEATTKTIIQRKPGMADQRKPSAAVVLNQYSDSDDDISFILSKTVTVLREDDAAPSKGPVQVDHMQDFTGYGRSKQRNDGLDDIDGDDWVEKKLQKMKNLSRFIQDGDDDEMGQYHDDSNDDDDDYVAVVTSPQQPQLQQQQQQLTTKSKISTQQQSSKTSPLTQFLHTNIAKSMVGTIIQPLGVSASVREDKSGRVITKYDPESTLYREFMYPFDTQENFPDDILLKQDTDVIQAIRRQISFQQQHANEEFEWILELDEDNDEENGDDGAVFA